jgi:hypothetical protein
MYDEDDDEDDDAPEIVGGSSVAELVEQAFYLFSATIERMTGKKMPGLPAAPETILPMAEVENIIAEHTVATEFGWAVKATSPEELQQKITQIYSALCERILSNVMAEGVKRGLVEPMFDIDKNAFVFSPTKKAEAMLKDDDFNTN